MQIVPPAVLVNFFCLCVSVVSSGRSLSGSIVSFSAELTLSLLWTSPFVCFCGRVKKMVRVAGSLFVWDCRERWLHYFLCEFKKKKTLICRATSLMRFWRYKMKAELQGEKGDKINIMPASGGLFFSLICLIYYCVTKHVRTQWIVHLICSKTINLNALTIFFYKEICFIYPKVKISYSII